MWPPLGNTEIVKAKLQWLRHCFSRVYRISKSRAPVESSDTTSHSPTSWSIIGLQLPETEMAERRGIPIEFSKSLLTGLVFLPQPNGVRRAKPNAMATSFISASDPPKSMIRSFALSGAGGRVFTARSPFFLAKSTQGVATAYCGGSE